MYVRMLMATSVIISALVLGGCSTANTSSSATTNPSGGASAEASTQASAASAGGSGYYSAAQASDGATVYSTTCSTCHGANLQGQSGPPLTGSVFAKSLVAYGTAQQMYD